MTVNGRHVLLMEELVRAVDTFEWGAKVSVIGDRLLLSIRAQHAGE